MHLLPTWRALAHTAAFATSLICATSAAHAQDAPRAPVAAKLSARRVQAALMPNAVYLKLRRDGALPADLVVVDEPEARPQMLGLYVNRQAVAARTLALLEKQLDDMVRSGWMRQRYAQHFGEAETRRMEEALTPR